MDVSTKSLMEFWQWKEREEDFLKIAEFCLHDGCVLRSNAFQTEISKYRLFQKNIVSFFRFVRNRFLHGVTFGSFARMSSNHYATLGLQNLGQQTQVAICLTFGLQNSVQQNCRVPIWYRINFSFKVPSRLFVDPDQS